MFQQVGNDEAAPADEDEIACAAVVQCGAVGFAHRGVGRPAQTVLCRLFANDVGGQGARYGGLRKIIYGIGGQHGEHARNILVVHHAQHDAQPLAVDARELTGEVGESARVVPRVAYGSRPRVHRLPPPLQTGERGDMGKPFAHGVGGDVESRLPQHAQGAEYRCGVFFLIQSAEFVVQGAVVGAVEAPSAGRLLPARPQHVALLRKNDRRRHFAGFSLEYAACFVRRFADDHRHAFFDDARFFAGDGCQRVAQQRRVVVTDVGDDAGAGRDDVRAVEPSAQTRFHYRDVAPAGGEVVERHGHGQLEKRRVNISARFEVFAREIEHGVAGYHFAVHPYALAEIDEVRRRVKPRFVAAPLQNGGKRVACRAFPVGACHVYGGVAAVGVPRKAVEGEAVVESGFISCLSDLLIHRQLSVEIFERFFVVHFSISENRLCRREQSTKWHWREGKSWRRTPLQK